MAEEGSDQPPAQTDGAETLTLQELADREARKRDASTPPAAKLPPFLGNLTRKQIQDKSRGFVGVIGFLVGAWLCYSVGGALASFTIGRFLLVRQTGLEGTELWTAQLLLAAPYLVLAFGAGVVLRARSALPRRETACLVMAVAFALSRLSRFHWCGPADPLLAILARLGDAAAVFLATYLGFGIRKAPAGSDMERFGPGPIEP
ncbi:MAG: hypothetical protein WEB59_13685 [Thermoanaerobaculia bacterium]